MWRTKEGKRTKGDVILGMYLQEPKPLTFNTDMALSIPRSLSLLTPPYQSKSVVRAP